jgi:hypothetical protein
MATTINPNSLLANAPALPSIPDISQFTTAAQNQLDPGFNNVVSALQNQGNQQKATDQMLAQQQKDQMTTVQKNYADLANELNVNQGIETQQAQQTGLENVSSAESAMAKSGIDQSAQGAFAAGKYSAQENAKLNLSNIAARYNAKQTDLTDALNSNLQQLNQKYDQYMQQGNMDSANMVSQIAQVQYQHQQQITTLAQQFEASYIKSEQDVWKDYMDVASLQMKVNTYNLSVQRLGVEQQRIGIEQQNANANTARANIEKQRAFDTQVKDNISSDVISTVQHISQLAKSGEGDVGLTEKAGQELYQKYQQAYGSNAPSLDQIMAMLYTERNKSIYKGINWDQQGSSDSKLPNLGSFFSK